MSTTRTNRTVEDEEHGYICGQCGFFQYAIRSQEPPVPCVDCAWPHREVKKYDLPADIYLDLTQYG
jgi:rubrerythrin